MEVSLQIFKKNGGGCRTLLFVWDGSENKIMVFSNENNDLNLFTAYYFSFMVSIWMFIGFLIHLCWFHFQCIFSTNYDGPVDVCPLKVGNGGFGQSWWWRHHNAVNDVVLVSLLFTLDMFRATFCCFRFDFGHVGVCGALIVVNTSTSIYKVIRPVLNFLFFFTIRFHKH